MSGTVRTVPHLDSTSSVRPISYYIQFGLARAPQAVKSPFEPSNRSSPVFLQALRTAFLTRASSYILEIVVCRFCGLSATLLGFRMRYETTLSPGTGKRSFLLFFFRQNDRDDDAPFSNFFPHNRFVESINWRRVSRSTNEYHFDVSQSKQRLVPPFFTINSSRRNKKI